MARALHRLILVDASEGRDALAQRLTMQGYAVEVATDPGHGARLALEHPPSAVVADLWMPSISGVQLCRLLRNDPSTAHVPVILRGSRGHRDKFWAEHAGAAAYVAKGRMGDLVRAIEKSIDHVPRPTIPPSERSVASGLDVRDRIAAQLDQALFDSVIASEIRALATTGDFERLFDRFSQLFTQITSYRWIALTTETPGRFALHSHPKMTEIATREAGEAFGAAVPISLVIEDEDPYAEEEGPPAIVEPIWFGNAVIGQLAVACRAPAHPGDAVLVRTVARELGGPLRIVTLVEESQRQARIDALTGLLNRRAFLPALEIEVARAARYRTGLGVLLIDVDHFKAINDRHGHGAGDQVLSGLGRLLASTLRNVDVVARWGGEEFVAMLPSSDVEGARRAAERVRAAAAALSVTTPSGEALHVTISVGVAVHQSADTADGLVDRADRAMYLAKTGGRNRVEVACSATIAAAPTDDAPLLHA